ncbi:hypothetical protein Tco_0527240 [Tanacetum coccineum]
MPMDDLLHEVPNPSKASIDKGKEIQREEKRLKEKKVVSSIGFSREVDARLCLFAPFKSFESQLKLAEKDFGEGASDLRSPKRMKKIKMMKQRDEPTKKSRSVEYRWQWKGMHTIVLIELTLKIQMRTAKGYKLGEYYDTCRGTLLELRVLDVYMCCLIGKYLCLLSLEGKVERKVGPLPGLYGMFVDGEWLYQLTKFHVQRVDMVINPPWNLPFLGAKGLTSPEQTATGVNTPGSDENRLKLYDLMYKIVNVADIMD